MNLGPRRVWLTYQISVGIVYPIIFLTGIFGNVCTCVVIARNRYLHNSTNFYLFNLAISDLLLIISGLPIELYQTLGDQYPWSLGDFFCHFRSFIGELSPTVSVLTITAFTVERYVAICHPLKSHSLSSFHRSLSIIGFCWLFATVYVLPIGIISRPDYTLSYANVLDYVNSSDLQSCPIPKSWTNKNHVKDSLYCSAPLYSLKITLHISAFLFFGLPMTFIAIFYTRIALVLYSTSVGRQVAFREKHQPRKPVVRMLVAVVVAFFICWAPFHLQRVVSIYWTDNNDSPIKVVLFYLSGLLYFVSCTINPVLYNLMSIKFRRAFWRTFCRWNLRRKRRKRSNCAPPPVNAECKIHSYMPAPHSTLKPPSIQEWDIIKGQFVPSSLPVEKGMVGTRFRFTPPNSDNSFKHSKCSPGVPQVNSSLSHSNQRSGIPDGVGICVKIEDHFLPLMDDKSQNKELMKCNACMEMVEFYRAHSSSSSQKDQSK